MTTAIAEWVAELRAALDPMGLLNPGKAFRRAAVADLAGVAGLVSGA